jgi:hypothetical protein
LLSLHFAGLDQELWTEQGQVNKEEDPKTAHAISLQTCKSRIIVRREVYWGLRTDAISQALVHGRRF